MAPVSRIAPTRAEREAPTRADLLASDLARLSATRLHLRQESSFGRGATNGKSVEQGPVTRGVHVAGREPALVRLDGFLHVESGARAPVPTGGRGMGKTTLCPACREVDASLTALGRVGG
jgi:hypothetical protein